MSLPPAMPRNAEEGYAVLRNHPIQVILSDQRMPDVSGATFLATIREAYPEAIRMLITGYTDMQALVDAVNQGQIHRYISKPWDPEAIRQYVMSSMPTTAIGVLSVVIDWHKTSPNRTRPSPPNSNVTAKDMPAV